MYAYFKRLDYFSTGGCTGPGVQCGRWRAVGWGAWLAPGEGGAASGGTPLSAPLRLPARPMSSPTRPPCSPPWLAECVYAPFAARGFAREFVKDLEVGAPLRV